MEASATNPESMDANKRQILSDITQAIFAASDHVPPSQKIEMDTTLISDLAFESIEIAGLFFRLTKHYAGAASLGELVLEMSDTDKLSDIPVGKMVDFIANSLRQEPAGPS